MLYQLHDLQQILQQKLKGCYIYLCFVSCLLEFYEGLESQMQEFSHCRFLRRQGYLSGPAERLAGF
jgi:hypothetical protein